MYGVWASAGYQGGDRVADLGGLPRALALAVLEVLDDGGVDLRGSLGVAEVVQHERDRADGGGGVGDLLARDVGRRAVDRLEHRRRRTVRVHVAGRSQADATGDGSGE